MAQLSGAHSPGLDGYRQMSASDSRTPSASETPTKNSSTSPAVYKGGLVDAKEVASVLDVSCHWVYRAVKEYGMPSYRLGRYVRFDLDEVLEWVRAGKASV